jgi:hypothetical protein
MNVFKALASSNWGFREEFISAFIGYLAHPKMDHNLEVKFLINLLSSINEENKYDEMISKMTKYQIIKEENPLFSEDILENEQKQILVQLECSKAGNADIVINLFNEYFIIIENKILSASFDLEGNQLVNEYNSLKNVIKEKHKNTKIINLYLVPADIAESASKTLTAVKSENKDDGFNVITWINKNDTDTFVSIVDIINNFKGEQFIHFKDFIENNFRGYRKIINNVSNPDLEKVENILKNTNNTFDNKFIGPAPPLVLINQVWGNINYIQEDAKVLDYKPNFMYVEVDKYIKIVNWSINKGKGDLNGIEFYNDFGILELFRISKYSKLENDIYINLKPEGILKNKPKMNKLDLLKSLNKEEILSLTWKELHVQTTPNSRRIKGCDFLAVLSAKGIEETDIK